jgi:hypothetical protein
MTSMLVRVPRWGPSLFWSEKIWLLCSVLQLLALVLLLAREWPLPSPLQRSAWLRWPPLLLLLDVPGFLAWSSSSSSAAAADAQQRQQLPHLPPPQSALGGWPSRGAWAAASVAASAAPWAMPWGA